MQIVSDFVGAGASKEAMQAVVKHKMKSVQEIIAMGGALDSDEEEEIRDTSKLEFEQLEVFGRALKEWGSSRSKRSSPLPICLPGKHQSNKLKIDWQVCHRKRTLWPTLPPVLNQKK
jgi:hypothetical protein